ncbi:MAG: nucleotide exchange factor GrpE [Aerococcus sp.]|nr:nucleotide exchange factor GrpE [Aerococcus sp.]
MTEEEKENVSTEETDEQKQTAGASCESVEETDSQDESKATTDVDQLKALEEQLDQKENQILRLSAEIKNMQVRASKERTQAAKFRSQSLAKALLPVIDSLEKALEIEADDEASNQLKRGIELVHTNFLKAFESEGVTVIDPAGEPFDPNYHQSISSVPADDAHPADTVVQVYQKGYALNDRVLRPAMVSVSQ